MADKYTKDDHVIDGSATKNVRTATGAVLRTQKGTNAATKEDFLRLLSKD